MTLNKGAGTFARVRDFFVNRSGELDFFRQAVLPPRASTFVYCLTGENEIGKTWLLHKLCLALPDDTLTVLMDFSRGGYTDYLTILREIQLALNKDAFNRFLQRTTEALKIPLDVDVRGAARESGPALEIGEQTHLNNVSFSGQFAAGDIINIYTQIQARPETLQQPYLVEQITQTFLEDLAAFAGERQIAFFFDDVGGGTPAGPYLESHTRRWLLEEFVRPLCEGLLPSARFILTQVEEPDARMRQNLHGLAEYHRLAEFSGDTLFEVYHTYLVQSHEFPSEEVNDLVLTMFHSVVGGRPARMFEVADDIKRIFMAQGSG